MSITRNNINLLDILLLIMEICIKKSEYLILIICVINDLFLQKNQLVI